MFTLCSLFDQHDNALYYSMTRVQWIEADDVATDTENRAEEVEKKKQEQLSKQKQGKASWEEQLASDSESAVRVPDIPKHAWTKGCAVMNIG